MSYIDGFVAAVPTANKQLYAEHAREICEIFREYGALQYFECWGDDVPDGEVTSFPMAVKCQADETVCFSWVVWPTKEIRQQAQQKMRSDSRFDPEQMKMPFDGTRLIYGGFEVLVEA